MSDGAHNGHDDISFYEADIGYTWELSVGIGGASTPDNDGPLPPGRYLIQAFALTAGAVCWVHRGAAGVSLSLTAEAGRRRIPLTGETILGIETHVRKGESDKIGAITSAGTCTLFITHVSTTVST